MNRRRFLGSAAAALLVPRALARRRAGPVVLYSSVDDFLLREFVRDAAKDPGLDIRLVGDTEATKTTGLVERLFSERARPRADVWWSSEPFGTVRLAEAGLLEPCASRAEADFGGSWPAGLRATDGTWYGFAPRARVIVYNTARIKAADVPRRPSDLARPEWKGRIGMARPEFGTTRGHMAALLDLCGEETFKAWLLALHRNGLRLFDGNAAVARAAAFGEIDAGLTDTDDVYSAQRQGWPVALVMEEPDPPDHPGPLCGRGPIALPNTVARVKGGPNPNGAGLLIDAILSERTERMLARSDSRNAPIRDSVRRDHPELALPPGPALDFAAVAAKADRAIALCRETLG